VELALQDAWRYSESMLDFADQYEALAGAK
jgi:hypothetical protein